MSVTLGLAITLSVSYEISSEKLIVKYTVVNQCKQSIYLFDKAYKATQEGVAPRDDYLLVSLEPPDTAVVASKLLPVPPGTAFATPLTALGTLVKAGETFRGTASAPLPLKLDGTTSATKEFVCRRVRFELGYVVDVAELAAKPTNLKQVFELTRAAWNKQAVLKTEPREMTIQGLIAK